MLKKIFLIILFIVIICLLVLGWQLFDFLRFDSELESQTENLSNQSQSTEVNQDKGLNPVLVKTIEDYLVTLPELAWQVEEGTSNICVFENLDEENFLFPLSLWVYCSEYRVSENGEIEKFSGVSLPLLLDYPNELSFYDPAQFVVKIPGDGSNYGKDIKEIFPKNVQDKILNHNSIESLKIEMDEKIIEKLAHTLLLKIDRNSI